MWFTFSIAALLCWSGSDLFSKIGCRDGENGYSHLKMVAVVGTVMGLHALYQILFRGVRLNLNIMFVYLPVSMLYILSMAIGYLGLRYIELSISSPICNSSGAVVAILSIAMFGLSDDIPAAAFLAVALVCIGVAALGVTEANESEELRRARQEESNYRYAKSWFAILIPIVYCLLDALGTLADSRVLEVLDDDSANAAYEITFLIVGAACAVYVYLFKGQKFTVKTEIPKLTGAVFETAGQFFYIKALADTEHVAFAAPVISSYCIASVLWGRVFLKEKLTGKHYASICIVIAGIIILGILDI